MFAVNNLIMDFRALFESEIPFLVIFAVEFVLKIEFAGISPNFRSPRGLLTHFVSCFSLLLSLVIHTDEKQKLQIVVISYI